jgi:acyl-homoserine lactone acylase PvdQ
MKKLVILLIACASSASAQNPDLARWRREARSVTIVRDDWGIPHIYGRTDADVVFGLLYAQAEDDFSRIENNYLESLGRLAEAEGESAIWRDLRARLYNDPDSLQANLRASPPWLRRLASAWADGLNFFLYRHPEVHPRVIARFEPGMALSFSEGSIGPDIEWVCQRDLVAFYGRPGERGPREAGRCGPASGDGADPDELEPGGSNGIAVAASNTANHRSLLLINPHTSFFFRDEVQTVSQEGLNAYGAVTWGQFFIYQGFNDRLGWMHTSSGVDAIDEYLETVVMHGDRPFYRYGTEERPMVMRPVLIRYRTGSGTAERRFTLYRTHHGPVIGRSGERWVSIALMNRPVDALIESWTRTKARDFAAFRGTLDLRTNSSNNTVYADAAGGIAYFQANFIPRRDTSFNWKEPVDGSNPATDWHGLLPVDSIPHVVNPASGWIYNSNDAPWQAAGPDSPRKASFPAYVENGGESARGHHAVRVLEHTRDFTLESLTSAAFDSYLPWFEKPIPALVKAWDAAADDNPMKERLREQIGLLRSWDMRWSATSVPTTLAVFWGENISRRVARAARGAGVLAEDYIQQQVEPAALLASLAAASDSIALRFGTWRTPWGDVNRFQRLNDIIQPTFNDSGPSIPVAFTAGQWGSLAAFAARSYPGTRKRYGSSGNSFVAVVEFGDSVRARAVTAGGISGTPGSPHFNDQAERYASGNLRDVYFYRSQLQGHIEREYHPGS